MRDCQAWYNPIRHTCVQTCAETELHRNTIKTVAVTMLPTITNHRRRCAYFLRNGRPIVDTPKQYNLPDVSSLARKKTWQGKWGITVRGPNWRLLDPNRCQLSASQHHLNPNRPPLDNRHQLNSLREYNLKIHFKKLRDSLV